MRNYADRAAHNRNRHAEERQLSKRISAVRLVVFLVAAALLLTCLISGAYGVLFVVSLTLFVVFAWLVAWHARVNERADWHDALRVINERSLARVERRWSELPSAEAPQGADLSQHPYAIDLDLFGQASLYQLLGPAATAPGSVRLAEWLLAPADTETIRSRQKAVEELATQDDWREELAARGLLASGARQRAIDAFVKWAEEESGSTARSQLPLRIAVYSMLTLIWLSLISGAVGAIPASAAVLPAVVALVFSLLRAPKNHGEFDRAGAGEEALMPYAALFEQVTRAQFTSAELRERAAGLVTEGISAPVWMRKLNRILSFADLRRMAPLFYLPLQAVTLWDFHMLFALQHWRRTAGQHIRAWLNALGEVDALACLATLRSDNRDWCMPTVGGGDTYKASQLGHPLIAAPNRIANDVEVGPPGTLLLVTGSNMSGKSTMLRAVGLNAVLAQAGACVCAEQLDTPSVDLQSSIRVHDSLELGLSYFMAAIARLKGVVDAAQHPREGRMLLYLLDEIMQGTNSAERSIAVQAVVRHLLNAGAIGAMSTHDLNLVHKEPVRSAAKLVHFTEIVNENGGMSFDYKLREGVATSRNALRLMKLIGIEVDE